MPKTLQNALWIAGVLAFLYLAVEINGAEASTPDTQNPPALPTPASAIPTDGVIVNLCDYAEWPQMHTGHPISTMPVFPDTSQILPTIPPAQITSIGQANTYDFIHSNDFRSVKCNGKEYHLTKTQASVIKRLYEYHQKGIGSVHQDTLLEKADVYSTRIRDVFKGSKALGTLVISHGKGYFHLVHR